MLWDGSILCKDSLLRARGHGRDEAGQDLRYPSCQERFSDLLLFIAQDEPVAPFFLCRQYGVSQ